MLSGICDADIKKFLRIGIGSCNLKEKSVYAALQNTRQEN